MKKRNYDSSREHEAVKFKNKFYLGIDFAFSGNLNELTYIPPEIISGIIEVN